jgi:hypothetical protein
MGASHAFMSIIDELKSNIDTVLAAIPRMFLFPDFHKVGVRTALLNTAHRHMRNALRIQVILHFLAAHSGFQDFGVGLKSGLVGSFSFLLRTLSEGVGHRRQKQSKEHTPKSQGSLSSHIFRDYIHDN